VVFHPAAGGDFQLSCLLAGLLAYRMNSVELKFIDRFIGFEAS
jgi:hypothetical protein